MQKQKLDDSVLVSNYIDGSERSLEILVGRHKQRIYSFIYSKIFDRDITEDIFQDAFIKVIKNLKLGKYNEEGKFVPWVMRIAHNSSIPN
jgi:RNA polymerase sigma-70 factor (ECF subfamily)